MLHRPFRQVNTPIGEQRAIGRVIAGRSGWLLYFLMEASVFAIHSRLPMSPLAPRACGHLMS